MFHVYFGGFDVVVYAIAAVFAIYLADAICSGIEGREQVEKQVKQEVYATQPAPIKSVWSEPKASDSLLVLDAQIYELRGQLVVRVDDMSGSVPGEVKTLSLRGDPVIRISDLQTLYQTVAIDAGQVIQKWKQWSKQKKKQPKKQHRNPIKEAASLNGGIRHGVATC
ncbi:MAG: hypothetical protein WBA57_18460 [Elainellaceae cyanobacterium]